MVKAWREDIVIPTYECGAYEKNPIFLEKRVYQGSSGVVYPYPVIESIADEKTDHTYHAVWLENEYIKVMILPELGGRVQMAYDKIKQRHFVYYNHVIKPALVGLAGPWISGGIEFNWPQHHRPSTFMEVDCTIEEKEDGSVTVWVNEMERMFHQKGMAGFTLRPGCAYLEINVKFYNRTELPQTFLWWANPAVHVNDDYQSVFPPDINAVFDHGKRAVSTFPIATGTYYKMDYSAGVDISNYKNIKVPTSYMGVNSKYDFEGGYENDTKGGMLHVANHHVSPGKKQWTWGNGDFGQAWDRNLTDEDGPYIELMAGVYTENQPDFSWIQPYEEKEFTQYFMPYRELGIVKQASKDIIMNVDEAEHGIRLRLMTTSKQDVKLVVKKDDGTVFFEKTVQLTPAELIDQIIETGDTAFDEITVSANRLIWHAESDEVKPVPDAAEAALSPEDTKTNEQLYLTGLHLEQYRHATWSPLDYYEEALRRDPNDVRCNNALGLWYIRRGRFAKAEPYLRRAVKILMKRNPNPYEGEPLYNLALALKYQGKIDEAYDWFYKATWNGAWQDAAYFACAQISVMQNRMEDALYELDRALIRNWHHHKARALKAAVLKELGREAEANALIEESLQLDHFNYGCLFEKGDTETIRTLMHGNPLNYHELALDYAQAGLWEKCIAVLQFSEEADAVNPMTFYYEGWAKECLLKNEKCRMKNEEQRTNASLHASHSTLHTPSLTGRAGEGLLEGSCSVEALFEKAEQTSSYCCFPNRLEDILALRCANKVNPSGAKAYYYLGCLYYDKRQYDVAVEAWEESARLDETFPSVWRNLALAAFNKEHHAEKALKYMERAFQLDTTDARILMELDQLYKRLQYPHADRLARLQQYPELIQQRDDLILEEITLLNQLRRYEEAKTKLDAHHFHPWEGGEGKVSLQYQTARVEMAKEWLMKNEEEEMKNEEYRMKNDNYTSNEKSKTHSSFGAKQPFFILHSKNALSLLEECLVYPHHLGEGKLYGTQENDFYYLMGLAYEQMGDMEQARECWLKATEGPTEPAAAMYYNDAKPDKIFYAGLAYRKLADSTSNEEEKTLFNGKANGTFYRLITYGEKHLFDTVKMDYFAVSLPDLLIWEGDLQQNNTIHCKYMMALGYYGIGNETKALRYLREAEALNLNHQGIQAFRTLIQQ
jgi:tetratricopeptide (TPR) repeat protein